MVEKKVICERAETCTQKLISCLHQIEHIEMRNGTLTHCCTVGYCSISEIECKCIEVI